MSTYFPCFKTLDDCFEQGEPYQGNVSISIHGRPCLTWSLMHELVIFIAEYDSSGADYSGLFDLDDFPDDNWIDVGNKCRSM